MKCGPDECPIRVFSDLTPAEQRVERKRTAEKMTAQGFTQEQIAKQLGVSQQTIARDLEGLLIVSKPNRPKGGRPKSPKKPKPESHERIIELHDEGASLKEIAAETGLGERMVSRVMQVENARREGRADPIIDPKALSQTAQQKLESAVRQHQRKLDAEFENRVQEEYQARLNEFLPEYKKKLDQAEELIKSRDGVMTRAIFKKILACLHPDRGMGEAALTDAFQIFNKLERVLVKEVEMPTPLTSFPKTYEEMMAMKQRASEARKAKRGGKQAAVV